MLQRNLVYTGVTHGKDLGATIVEFFVVPAPASRYRSHFWVGAGLSDSSLQSGEG